MVYSQERLDEAVSVLKADCARLLKEQEEKYAQTHYRDDFHLRRHTKALTSALSLYHDYGSDADDDDYNPDGRTHNRQKTSSRRDLDRCFGEVKSTRRKKRVAKAKPPKTRGKSTASVGLANVFVTFRFFDLNSNHELRKLADEHNTHIDHWLNKQPFDQLDKWRLKGGRLGRLGSSEELRQLAIQLSEERNRKSPTIETLSDIDEPEIPARRLRNGKIRASTEKAKNPKSTTVDMSGEELFTTKKQPVRITNTTSFKQCRPVAVPGLSVADAISIEDSESEGCVNSNSDCISKPDTDRQDNTEDIEHIEMIDSSDEDNSNAAQITTIHTCFGHPINYGSTKSKCNFCTDYRFGIVGHKIREVTVARNPQNDTLTELSKGHTETHGPTQLCVQCALDRMMVTRCLTHQMHRFSSDISKADFAKYIRDLTCETEGRSAQPPPPIIQVCSICPMPASYRCTSLQKRDRMLHPVRNPAIPLEQQIQSIQAEITKRKGRNLPHDLKLKEPIYGCGLVLCDKCKVVVDRWDGRLVRSEVKAAAEARGGVSMTRGDVDFLFRGSDLWKSYNPS